jgi:hypothetical protein
MALSLRVTPCVGPCTAASLGKRIRTRAMTMKCGHKVLRGTPAQAPCWGTGPQSDCRGGVGADLLELCLQAREILVSFASIDHVKYICCALSNLRTE